jgi:hypothetical protein
MNQAPPDPSVKSITLTGGAARSEGHKRPRRRTVRAKQDGGAPASSESATLSTKVNIIQQLAAQIPPSAPSIISAATAVAAAPPGSQQQGGAKQNIKLVPAKSTNKTRVLLAPKATNQNGGANHRAKTKKQKKLSLRVSNIRRKVASTRKHIHASTSLPFDKIRKELVDAKLLNPSSKAPEALIRKIYADFKITTHTNKA